jgi:hypothetical protein
MSPLSSTKTRKKSIKRRNGRSRSCHKLLRMSNSICSRGDTFGSSHRSLLFSFALFFLLFVTAFHLASAVPMQEMPENYVDYMNGIIWRFFTLLFNIFKNSMRFKKIMRNTRPFAISPIGELIEKLKKLVSFQKTFHLIS